MVIAAAIRVIREIRGFLNAFCNWNLFRISHFVFTDYDRTHIPSCQAETPFRR